MFNWFKFLFSQDYVLGPGRTALEKKGGEKKGRPAVNEVVTAECTGNIHQQVPGVGFTELPIVTQRDRRFAMKEMEPQMGTLAPDSTKLCGPKE